MAGIDRRNDKNDQPAPSLDSGIAVLWAQMSACLYAHYDKSDMLFGLADITFQCLLLSLVL